MTPRLALAALLASSTAACASGAAGGRPPIPPGVPPQFVHFADAKISVGDVAPDFTLSRTVGEGRVALSSLRGRPVVLIFASHT
jgi:hypothetical protein